jgi:large conductance mechanosensitive channel
MIKEFKEFLSRGNVVDLAVAVVIGTAFGAVVNSIVTNLITPLVGVVGSRDFGALDFTINGSRFVYGNVINSVIQFLSIAAAVFLLVVKPLNMLAERRKRGQVSEEEAPPTEAELLTQIRDLLASR